ncbi:MAG: isocitrate/isopropylmalate dehydrogenase family protein [Rhizobiales bacterium]|nr:isocitrate/isopropylmalate dehydrogenase family protein [Hyphomicrobiales bacterium]
MANSYSICVVPGDGIGSEVTGCARRMLDSLATMPDGPSFSFNEQPAGYGAWIEFGTSIPQPTVDAAKAADAVMLGACDVARIPAGAGEPLGTLRKELVVNASVRPARSVPGISKGTQSIDCLVVREVTEGLYSGIEYDAGPDAACAVRLITRGASTRAAKVAFEQARMRRKRVTAVHKIGALKLTDGLFLECVRAVGADYPDVELETANVDACAMHMVQHPEQFDVILATNVFGDILSDLAIGLAAGLGLAPSACVGDRWGYFEPVHGTAPDIAGKGIANPCATILSAAMMLRHLGETKAADAVEAAVLQVLKDGKVRTGDIGGAATSAQMTDAIIAAIHAGGRGA